MRTIQGRVVYDRKLHPFKMTDILRIIRKSTARTLIKYDVLPDRVVEFIGKLQDFLLDGFGEGWLFQGRSGNVPKFSIRSYGEAREDSKITIIAFIIEE